MSKGTQRRRPPPSSGRGFQKAAVLLLMSRGLGFLRGIIVVYVERKNILGRDD